MPPLPPPPPPHHPKSPHLDPPPPPTLPTKTPPPPPGAFGPGGESRIKPRRRPPLGAHVGSARVRRSVLPPGVLAPRGRRAHLAHGLRQHPTQHPAFDPMTPDMWRGIGCAPWRGGGSPPPLSNASLGTGQDAAYGRVRYRVSSRAPRLRWEWAPCHVLSPRFGAGGGPGLRSKGPRKQSLSISSVKFDPPPPVRPLGQRVVRS